jgi:hypothetical protein
LVSSNSSSNKNGHAMVELKENGYLALNCNHSFRETITKY